MLVVAYSKCLFFDLLFFVDKVMAELFLRADFFGALIPPLNSENTNRCYNAISEYLWTKIRSAFPKTVNSVKTLTEDKTQNNEYTLVYGAVQSGKSRAIMVIAWYCCFISLDRCPVVLTINLDSVRTDFMKKAGPNGEINQLINTAVHDPAFENLVRPMMTADQIRELDLTGGFSGDALYRWFSLKPTDFRAMSKQQHAPIGDLPVLLQNPANLNQVIKYHKINNSSGKKVFVIVDEIHRMYTEPMQKRLFGLTEKSLPKKNGATNCICMMYWLHDKCRELKLELVGVTATPARATTDVHVYPSRLIKLESDAVVIASTHLQYYGSFNEKEIKTETTVFDVTESCETVVSVLKNIISRPACSFQFGNETRIAIKTVLITINHYQEDHQIVRSTLESDPEIGGLLEVFVVNSNDDCGQKLQEVFDSLARVSKTSKLHQTKLAYGAVVIIGQGCFAAGVSVKPIGNQRIEFRERGNERGDESTATKTFMLFGLTDQIYVATTGGRPKSLECNLQAMRIFGWYPRNYDLHLWSSQLDLDLLRDQLKTNRHLVDRYDQSPESIKTYVYDPRLLYKLYDKDPYRADKASYPIERLNTTMRPVWTDGRREMELKTKVYPVGTWMADGDGLKTFSDQELLTLSGFFGQRDQQITLRRRVKMAVETFMDDTAERKLVLDRIYSKFQIPYSDTRYREILRASMHPGPTVGSAPVNAYLTGFARENTRLSDMFLVVFEEEWDKRPSGEANCTYYFQDTPKTWIIVHPHKTSIKEHGRLDYMITTTRALSREHANVLSRIDNVGDYDDTHSGGGSSRTNRQKEHKFKNGWHMFMHVLRNLYAGNKIDIKGVSQKWKGLSTEQKLEYKKWIKRNYASIADRVSKVTQRWLSGDNAAQIDPDPESEDISIEISESMDIAKRMLIDIRIKKET